MDGLGLVFSGRDNTGAASVTDVSSFDPTEYWKGKQKSAQNDIDRIIQAKSLAAKAGIEYKGIDTGTEWIVDRQKNVLPVIDKHKKAFKYFWDQGIDPTKNPDAAMVLRDIEEEAKTATNQSIADQKIYQTWADALADAKLKNDPNIDYEAGLKVAEEFKAGDRAKREEILKNGGALKLRFNPQAEIDAFNKDVGTITGYDQSTKQNLGGNTNDYSIQKITTASPAQVQAVAEARYKANPVLQQQFPTFDEYHKYAKGLYKTKQEEEIKSLQTIDKAKEEEYVGNSFKFGNNVATPITVETDFYETEEGSKMLKESYDTYVKAAGTPENGGAIKSFDEYKATLKPAKLPKNAVSIQKTGATNAENVANDFVGKSGVKKPGVVKALMPKGTGYEALVDFTEKKQFPGDAEPPLKVEWVSLNDEDGNLNENGGTIVGEWGGKGLQEIYNKALNAATKTKATTPEPKKYVGVPQGGF